jgi:hypothetical protein
MPQRQDYLMRLLDELAQLLAQALKFRQSGSHDAALHTILQAQERLFARPAQDFLSRPVDEQVHWLVVGETPANAQDKCLLYATLLIEAGYTYHAKGQAPLALGACQLALHMILLTTRKFPATESATQCARIARLLGELPEDDLHAEVKALLDRLERPGPAGGEGQPSPGT